MTNAIHVLVDHGFPLPDLAATRVQHQLALSIDFQLVGPFEVKGNDVRISAGVNDEVILELPLVAVINEVHSGIQVLVSDFGVGRNSSAPLAAILSDEVIDFAR